jgi:hypothetical protein
MTASSSKASRRPAYFMAVFASLRTLNSAQSETAAFSRFGQTSAGSLLRLKLGLSLLLLGTLCGCASPPRSAGLMPMSQYSMLNCAGIANERTKIDEAVRSAVAAKDGGDGLTGGFLSILVSGGLARKATDPALAAALQEHGKNISIEFLEKAKKEKLLGASDAQIFSERGELLDKYAMLRKCSGNGAGYAQYPSPPYSPSGTPGVAASSTQARPMAATTPVTSTLPPNREREAGSQEPYFGGPERFAAEEQRRAMMQAMQGSSQASRSGNMQPSSGSSTSAPVTATGSANSAAADVNPVVSATGSIPRTGSANSNAAANSPRASGSNVAGGRSGEMCPSTLAHLDSRLQRTNQPDVKLVREATLKLDVKAEYANFLSRGSSPSQAISEVLGLARAAEEERTRMKECVLKTSVDGSVLRALDNGTYNFRPGHSVMEECGAMYVVKHYEAVAMRESAAIFSCMAGR